jgi:hypothetical protein
MAYLSSILYPITLIITQVLITALAISFTPPSSLTRLALLPLLITATWLISTTCLQRIPRMSFASVIAGNGLTYLVRYIDLVLLSRWSYDTQAPTRTSSAPPQTHDQDRQKPATSKPNSNETPPPGTVLDRLIFGIHLTLTSRHVNTPWQVKNVPPFSPHDPHYTPFRAVFLRRNAIAALLYYLTLDITSFGVNPESNAVLFAAQKVPFFARLGQLTAEEIAVRVFSSVMLWVSIYCITSMGYSILGVIAVGMGVSQVETWRPPFGRVAEAYTVRRFWG